MFKAPKKTSDKHKKSFFDKPVEKNTESLLISEFKWL